MRTAASKHIHARFSVHGERTGIDYAVSLRMEDSRWSACHAGAIRTDAILIMSTVAASWRKKARLTLTSYRRICGRYGTSIPMVLSRKASFSASP